MLENWACANINTEFGTSLILSCSFLIFSRLPHKDWFCFCLFGKYEWINHSIFKIIFVGVRAQLYWSTYWSLLFRYTLSLPHHIFFPLCHNSKFIAVCSGANTQHTYKFRYTLSTYRCCAFYSRTFLLNATKRRWRKTRKLCFALMLPIFTAPHLSYRCVHFHFVKALECNKH